MTGLKILITIAIILIALVATALTAAADASVRLLGRGRIRRLADSGLRGARALDALSERPGRAGAVHALVSGAGFAVVSGVLMWELAQAALPGWLTVAIAAAAATAIVFVFGEALPRGLASANARGAGLASAPAAARIATVVYPVARVLSWVWYWTLTLISGERSAEVPWADADEARGADDESDGSVDHDAEYLEAVSGLGEKVVREVMVPRTDIVSLEDTASIDDAVRVATEAGISRVPVFHDTLDDVRGILYAKDLLRCMSDADCSRKVIDHMREVLFVPETKPVEELLREMRRRTHIAIVLDEYGGTAGLVTIEDLVEEIVGEIYDEYDQEVQMVTAVGDGSYRIDARVSIDDLNELFDTEIEVDADTIGGLVSELSGHIPDVGESVEIEGLRIAVAAKEGNRMRELIVEPAVVAADEGDQT